MDRLIGILTILLQKEKTTAPELASRFEVSRRTILRDLDTLSMAGIPITATRGGNGGIAIMEGYKISKSVLTSGELENLVAALKGLDTVSKQSNFEKLVSKLAPESAIISFADSMIIDLSSHYKDSLSEKIEILKQAIAAHKTVRFHYFYAKGEITRELEPYIIQFLWDGWYVFGWCVLRKDFRQFKLNRLWNLIQTDTVFELRAIPTERRNGGYPSPEPCQIRLLFTKDVRYRLIEEYGLHCYEETENGLLVSLTYTNKDYILSWILSFGDHAVILEPAEIREEFRQLTKKMAEQYE